ncbi:pitrilysin family protein [Aliivibrio sp. EL58]|uniref:M16 family metallopeptidase n=1 Tax=Aliivibrio sp. EL58 TaxID=2107582 RepID=UPI0015738C5A|nr:insulinase family protein [Aliivibrio sp. EL58]
MILKNILLLGSALLLSACQLMSSSNESTQLRFNPAVSVGVLDNGFTYYIAENQRPESRVYIRFVVNAGSMNEDDDQRGVAHIVEHMAFNGTKSYPENQVITELEKVGMKFGVDINAFTDFENTVYTLNLPNNDTKTLALTLDIVSDWASNVTMLKGDLDAERGIVLEEWRARLGPMLRLGDKKSAIEMAGSRYVTRDPIGDAETIKTVSKYRVADFYNKWYRPDNMSIVIVGDINTQEVKQLIEKKLGDKKTPTTPVESIDYSVPLNNKWRSATVSEEGMSSPSVELSFFSRYQSENSYARYKQDLTKQVATRLLNVRLQRWEQQESTAINSANFYSSNIGRETTQSVFSLQLFDENYAEATQELIAFIAQITQYGFSSAEVNGEISRLHKINESIKEQTTYSIDLAGDLMVSAASEQLLIGDNDKYQLNKRFLTEITLAEVNNVLSTIVAQKSKLLLTTQPITKQKAVLSASQLEKIWQQTMIETQPRWLVDNNQAVLPKITVKKGTIKQEKKWAEYNLTEYRLSNGSKLIYRYSDNNPGQVHFKALTSGGLRSVPKSDYHALRIATSLVDETGVGDVPQADIQTIFRGNPVVMSTMLDEHQQGYSGWAKTDSLDKMFQLFHLKLQASPISDKVLKQYQIETVQRSNELNSADRFVRKVSTLRYPDVETVYSENNVEVANLTSEDLSAIYQHYISSKTDYTYFVVGDVSPKEIEKLAATYLSSIRREEAVRQPYQVIAHSPKQRYTARDSKEPRAEVELYLTQPSQWRPDNAYYLELSGELVQEQLRLKLREQASGIYSVTSWFWQNPDNRQAEGRIQFTCAPDRVDELLTLTHQVLEDIVTQGADEQVLQNKLLQRSDQIDRYLRSDLGMLNAIEYSYMLTESPTLIKAQKRANNVATKQKVDTIMRNFLIEAKQFEAVLLPKK